MDDKERKENIEIMPKAKKSKKRSFWRFLLVSCLTGLMALGSFSLLVLIFDQSEMPFSKDVGIVIAEFFSVLWSCICSFLLNSKFTFKERNARRAGIFLYILFYAITTPLAGYMIVHLNRMGVDLILCKLIKMTINVFLDYAYCRFFIFKYIKKKYDETPQNSIDDN